MKRKTQRSNKTKENKKKTMNKLDRHSMFIICKYFNIIYDYFNIEKCCKEYNGLIEQFKYNPIPFKNDKEREVFKNIETYHFYERIEEEQDFNSRSLYENEREQNTEDERIKKCVYWKQVKYSCCKDYEREKDEGKNKRENEYKNIEYGKEDMRRYLFDHDEEEWKMYLKTEKVELEEGITSIGNDCFRQCVNLKEIIIPTSVSSIGKSCFHGCSDLSTINIPSSVSFIGECCFSRCSSLRTITIPSTITSIGYRCFFYCINLSSITIPSSVKSIGDDCFIECLHLYSISIPSSVTKIGNACFKRQQKQRKDINNESKKCIIN